MAEIRLKLPLKRDILRWVIERALHEYIRLERVLDEQRDNADDELGELYDNDLERQRERND